MTSIKNSGDIYRLIEEKLGVFFNERLKWLLVIEESGYYQYNYHLNG